MVKSIGPCSKQKLQKINSCPAKKIRKDKATGLTCLTCEQQMEVLFLEKLQAAVRRVSNPARLSLLN